MVASSTTLRIGIYGPEETPAHRLHCHTPWPSGYAAALREAGAIPVPLGEGRWRSAPTETLGHLHGLVWTGGAGAASTASPANGRLCAWCRKNGFPLLAVDEALHALNVACGGTLYTDLARELPNALQHAHPPEPGLRHAIALESGGRLEGIYGEGEIIVNSAHRAGLCRLARGFRVSARALDGVVEAIEPEQEGWFALGVQWRPASATASGLDIQLFRAFVEACGHRMARLRRRPRSACTSAA
jgi:putative glutamine amidotransferase